MLITVVRKCGWYYYAAPEIWQLLNCHRIIFRALVFKCPPEHVSPGLARHLAGL